MPRGSGQLQLQVRDLFQGLSNVIGPGPERNADLAAHCGSGSSRSSCRALAGWRRASHLAYTSHVVSFWSLLKGDGRAALRPPIGGTSTPPGTGPGEKSYVYFGRGGCIPTLTNDQRANGRSPR
jgi:hypothetical protein